MTYEPFTHDAADFVPATNLATVDISDAESRYAALFAEVIWDGLITPEKRRQLRTAAELLGLSESATRPVEEALLAAHESRHRIAVIEQDLEDEERCASRAARRSRKSLVPLADTDELRESSLELERVALTSRVDRLESDNARLVSERERLAQENERLSALALELEERLAESTRALEAIRATPVAIASPTAPAASRPGARPAPNGGRHRSRRAIADAPRSAELSGLAPLPAAGPSVLTPLVAGLPSALESLARAEPAPPLDSRDASKASGDAPLDAADPAEEVVPPPAAPPAPRVPEAPRAVVPRNDPAELHRLLRKSPRDPDLMRALYRSLQRADDLDRRFCIAHALVHLGEANDQERAIHAAHAEDAVVRPARALTEDEWRELVLHPDQDRMIGDVLAEIAPAVLLGHVTALRASLAPDELDPTLLAEPQSSTEPAVRSLGWAAAILGMKAPPIQVDRRIDRVVDVVLTPKPVSRLGARALDGRAPRELAFVAGSHLTWYRREHLLAQPSGSVRRLEDWVLAALVVASPSLPLAPESRDRVEPLAVIIKPLLGEPARGRLQRALGRFVEQGGRLHLARWLEAVEYTAASVGLLLANDLGAAENVLRIEPEGDAEGILDELLVFFTSKRCAVLRRRLGIAIDS